MELGAKQIYEVSMQLPQFSFTFLQVKNRKKKKKEKQTKTLCIKSIAFGQSKY